MISRHPQRHPGELSGRFAIGVVCSLLALCRAHSAAAEPTAAATPAAAATFDVALCQLAPRDATAAATDKAAKKRARAQLLAARRAYDASDYATSIRSLRESYLLDPTLDTLFNIAQVCREAGAAAEAIPLYEFTLKESEDDAIKADCQRHLGLLRPKVAQQHDERARELARADKLAEAAAAWEQAYRLDPRPAYLLQLGDAQRRGGQLADAIATYERAGALSGADDQAKTARATALKLRAEQAEQRAQKHVQAEEYAQAFSAWQEAERLDPQPRYVFQIAESARLAGLQRDALASYQRFLNATRPDELKAERQQAQSYVVAGRLREKEEQRVAEGRSRPIYKKWWLWTAIGGAVAAAVIVGGVIGSMDAPKGARLTDLPSQHVVDL